MDLISKLKNKIDFSIGELDDKEFVILDSSISEDYAKLESIFKDLLEELDIEWGYKIRIS
jgi:hypothetical protein